MRESQRRARLLRHFSRRESKFFELNRDSMYFDEKISKGPRDRVRWLFLSRFLVFFFPLSYKSLLNYRAVHFYSARSLYRNLSPSFKLDSQRQSTRWNDKMAFPIKKAELRKAHVDFRLFKLLFQVGEKKSVETISKDEINCSINRDCH